ncbi:MAG: hypothetical protein PHV97_07620 [Candidatus Omnitrophica bacterium]|nr:hypothetical protein [Candidatus Omnitrophota bacterium]
MLAVEEMIFACEGMIQREIKRMAEQIPNPVGIEAAVKSRLF